MKDASQVSPYFLQELQSFKLFIKLSRKHWEQEYALYKQAVADDKGELIYFRYDNRVDLSAKFLDSFPRYQKQSYLLMLVSLFEDYLNQLCLSIEHQENLSVTLSDFSGTGIERAKQYLKKMCGIAVTTNQTSWNKIKDAYRIRNLVAHNAGHLDPQKHFEQKNMVNESSLLRLDNYARNHLHIDWEFLTKLTDAMEEVANKVSESVQQKYLKQ